VSCCLIATIVLICATSNVAFVACRVLVLDEMDTLLSRHGVESDLCRLFELAHRSSHAFVLIGIANQVDFTERHLPLLKERLPDCRPRVLVFKAYSHETIEQILVDRLGGKQEASKMLNAHGITFLARKIASTTGDIRLALDTCRRILQHKVTREQDKENVENGSSMPTGRPMALTDMLRLIKHALESKSSMIVQSLPRNLQMILFASTRLVGSQPGALLGVDELYASYRDVCDAAGVLSPLSEREFRGSLDILSAESLLSPAELKRQLVKPSFSASELLQGFRSDAYFSRLI
jgi:cell division control protein 6